MTPSQIEAKRRIDLALDKIQKAQALVESAAQDISRVVHVRKSHDGLFSLYDRIKASWYQLSLASTSKLIDLDSEAKAKLK